MIAFPKTASATDLMTGSPSPVRDEQVRELGLARDAQVRPARVLSSPDAAMMRVSVPERGLETLFGNHDENLRFLEEHLKVRIRNQGSELLDRGRRARRGARAARSSSSSPT